MAELGARDSSWLDAASVAVAGRNPLRLMIAGGMHEVIEEPAGNGSFAMVIDGRRYVGWRYRAGDVVHVRVAGRTFAVHIPDPTISSTATSASGDEVRAPLPGTVVGLSTSAGATVRRGDTLLTIESMKVQMTLSAPRDGFVQAVNIAVNAVFDRGALLVVLQKPE